MLQESAMIYNNNVISEHIRPEFVSLEFVLYMILFREFANQNFSKFTSRVQEIQNWSVTFQVTS